MKGKKKDNNLLYDIDETPNLTRCILLSLQHVFAMFGATIIVPISINAIAGFEVIPISVALLTSGIGTLIYILCTKGKSPVYLGSSFAYIAPVGAAALIGGASAGLTGIMVVGIIYMIVALIIRLCGKGWIDKVLPPIIIGPMIMIIGLGLAPSAISSIGIDGSAFNYQNLIVALVTFLVTTIVALRGTKFLKVIPFLIGIGAGYITAMCFGMVDYSVIAGAKWFTLPHVIVPFISYKPNFVAVLTIAPVALVTICEHIGDHTVLGTIINKDLLKNPGLDRTLLGDGLATFVAGALGGPANTTYGENTSVVGMTKVASINVLKVAALIAIAFSFLGKVTAILSTIPSCVLGGACFLLYGFISVNGLRVLVENQVDFTQTKNVIVSASMLVLGLGGAVISIVIKDFTLAFSGMSLAAIVGILLNLLLPKES